MVVLDEVCDECWRTKRVVRIGDEYSEYKDLKYLCAECLRKALRLLLTRKTA